jgi:hypothetical protein
MFSDTDEMPSVDQLLADCDLMVRQAALNNYLESRLRQIGVPDHAIDKCRTRKDFLHLLLFAKIPDKPKYLFVLFGNHVCDHLVFFIIIGVMLYAGIENSQHT